MFDRDAATMATVALVIVSLVIVVLLSIMGRLPEWNGWTCAAIVAWLFLYAKAQEDIESAATKRQECERDEEGDE